MSFFPCIFQTYYFEELEGLLEELLFRLNSLHRTPPAVADGYREDSPVVSPVPRCLDTQVISYVYGWNHCIAYQKQCVRWTVRAV